MGSRVEQLTGLHAVREALRARRRRLHRLRIAGPPDPALLAAAEEAGVPVERVGPEMLPVPTEERGNPQRVCLEAEPLPEVPLETLSGLEAPDARLVLLDGVEDPQNLGAIARVAEAAGVAGLVLARRRAAPTSPAASRASAGALEWLPVARVPNLGRAIERLKESGYWLLGADPAASDGLYELSDRVLSGRLVVALGAEGRGLRPGVLERLDHRVQIPMHGHVASLNVATAAAVVLFELVRRGRI